MADVELINLDTLQVFMTDGRVLPITNMFDCNGDDCDADEAVCIVAGIQGYGFLTIDLEPGPTFH